MADVVRDPGLPQGPLVQSLVRGFAVLRCFDAATPRLTLSQIAEIAGLDRAAARRYLHTFAAMGYVGIEGRMFHLRPRILELGYSYLSSLSLPQVAAPFLSSLAEELAESCALTVLDGAELVYLATANTPRALAIRLTVGNRLPAYCTAMGRVLLGGLDGASLHERLTRSTELGETYGVMCEPDRLTGLIRQAQVRGWAVVDQELEQGVRSVAVPLHDGNGAIVAALSVSTPASRVSVAALKAQFRQRLALVARQIEEYSNGAGG